MKKSFLSLMILMLFLVACTSPVVKNGSQSSNLAEITTAVASTLGAMTPEVAKSPTTGAETSTDLLPHRLYLIGKDNDWFNQVFSIERDGKTKTQITFEPGGLDDYDVSQADGSIAYTANNQLLLVNADGSNRRMLVDGGPKESSASVTRPVFSPDGKTIAYAHQGLNLYSVSTGNSQLMIEDKYGDPLPEGQRLPVEIYMPERYSPDGTKLLLALGHWEAMPSHAVYEPAGNNLIRYKEGEEYLYCCSFHGGPSWSSDSSSFYGVASAHDYAYQQGALWKIDATSGEVQTVIPASDGSGLLSLPIEPYLAPDGQLYFFFGRYPENSGYFEAPVVHLVRTRPNDGKDISILRDENFRMMEEALWAPDASFVIVATAPEQSWDQGGGVLELYPTDGQKEPIWLAPLGKQMKWGP
jgi:hypothetical protein